MSVRLHFTGRADHPAFCSSAGTETDDPHKVRCPECLHLLLNRFQDAAKRRPQP